MNTEKKSIAEEVNIKQNSSIPYSVLSHEEMIRRMKNLHDQFCRKQKQHNQMVDAHVQANRVMVDQELHSYPKNVTMTDGEKQLEETRPNKFKRIFVTKFWKITHMVAIETIRIFELSMALLIAETTFENVFKFYL